MSVNIEELRSSTEVECTYYRRILERNEWKVPWRTEISSSISESDVFGSDRYYNIFGRISRALTRVATASEDGSRWKADESGALGSSVLPRCGLRQSPHLVWRNRCCNPQVQERTFIERASHIEYSSRSDPRIETLSTQGILNF